MPSCSRDGRVEKLGMASSPRRASERRRHAPERPSFRPTGPPALGEDGPVYTVITLRVEAPDQPEVGAPCNGCGVCCAIEPCPLGVLASRRMHGRCAALVWMDDAGRYRCGLIEEPAKHLPRLLRRWAPVVTRIARRYVSAGSGCDSDVRGARYSNAQK